MDENRAPYSPAIWELDDGGKTNLKQVWFPGAHSNVGGSYPDYGMANISLAWMMDQLSGNTRNLSTEFDPLDWIKFDRNAIDVCFKHTNRFYKSQADGDEYRGWAMGKVYDSNTFPQSLAGSAVRTPGLYRETDYDTGKYTEKYLGTTNEYIHSSVRARIDLAGREVEPESNYQMFCRWLWRYVTFQPRHNPYMPQRPRKGLTAAGPLHGWKLVDGHESHRKPNLLIDMSPGGIKQVHWEYIGKANPTTQIMREDVLAANGFEEQLLLHDQGKANKIIYSNNKWQVCYIHAPIENIHKANTHDSGSRCRGKARPVTTRPFNDMTN